MTNRFLDIEARVDEDTERDDDEEFEMNGMTHNLFPNA
jgi:hypothetical protein